jgi:hypothetical protein
VLAVAWPGVTAGQLPLAPGLDRGQSVTPAFEGWYPNPDGTFNLSFGYYNRNFEEIVDIPIGPNNRVEPGGPDQGQPTHFETRRRWGVFTVTVPKDFGNKEVTWTLVNRGQTLSIPGHLKREWMIDAISGDANGNRPPVIKFDPAGPTGQGPRGLHAKPIAVKMPQPATITVYAIDDGIGSRIDAAQAAARAAQRGGRADGGGSANGRGRGRGGEEAERNTPLGLAWVKHSGPGDVTFSDPRPKLEGLDVKATTTATFSAPGEYVLRVHAMDTTGADGSNQCCWTNGYVRVTVQK